MKYKTLINVVNYKSPNECIEFINCVLSCADSSFIKINIVDNSNCFNKIKTNFSQNVEIIYPHKNLGYLGGANFGLEKFKDENHVIPDWVIVSNSDILIKDKNFFQKLHKREHEPDLAILAPQITSTLFGKNQNPHLIERPRARKVAFHRYVYSFYPLLWFYHVCYWAYNFLKRHLGYRPKQSLPEDGKIYAAHGAFMILTREFFQRGGSLNYPCFIYGEEYFLSETSRAHNLYVKYDNEIQVFHKEHVSTGTIPNRLIGGYLKESITYIYHNFFLKNTNVSIETESKLTNMSALNLLGNANRTVLAFVTSVMTSRWLGAEDFGLVNSILAYTAFLNYILTFGFDSSLTYFTNLYKGKDNLLIAKMLRTGLIISISAGVLAGVTAYLIPHFFFKSKPAPFFELTVLFMTMQTCFWALASIISGFLRGVNDFKPTIVREQIIFPLVNLVGLILFVYVIDLGALGYALGYFLAAFITFIYVLLSALNHYDFFAKKNDAKEEKTQFVPYKEWFSFSLPVGFATALSPILTWAPIWVATLYVSPYSIGLLSVASKLTIFIQFLFLAVSPIASSYFAKFFQDKDLEGLRKIINKLCFNCTQWAIIFGAVLFLVGDYVLKIFGSEYENSLYSLYLLIPGSFFEACFGIYSQVLVMTGKNKYNVFNQIFSIFIGLFATWLLIPQMDILACAIGTSIIFITLNVLRLLQIYFLFRIFPYNKKQFFEITILFVFMFLTTWKFHDLAMSGNNRITITTILLLSLGMFFIYNKRDFLKSVIRVDKIFN